MKRQQRKNILDYWRRWYLLLSLAHRQNATNLRRFSDALSLISKVFAPTTFVCQKNIQDKCSQWPGVHRIQYTLITDQTNVHNDLEYIQCSIHWSLIPGLGTLEWDTFNPDCLIRISKAIANIQCGHIKLNDFAHILHKAVKLHLTFYAPLSFLGVVYC